MRFASSASSATPSQVVLEPEALSDPQTGYLVAELPGDLDEQSQAVLRGYLAYDRATWDAFRAMDADLSKVEQSSTDFAWTSYHKAYSQMQSDGHKATGSGTLYLKSVAPSLAGHLATVDACANQTGIVFVDLAGTAVSTPELQVKQCYSYTMINYDATTTSRKAANAMFTKHNAGALVLVACCLLASCQHPDKDQEHSYRPDPEMETSMLSIQDVPGATSVTWYKGRGGTLVTSCPLVEFKSDLISRDPWNTPTTSARFTLGEVIVTQTANLDIIEREHGEDIRTLQELLQECEGQPRIIGFPVLPPHLQGTETLTQTPPSELPTGTLGFHSHITAEDGTTQTIERIYAPITTQGHTPGLLVLTTRTPGNQPATPTPLDLLNKALTKANATLDPTALNPPTQTTPTPTPTH
ncbi:hypothetical protein [Actinomyces trachealis]|uniref:hypothetical protein n=1 Tax=Actinomyces trachealis TaxID=2763540 RepID=UPI0018929E1A|nr:hypothetical protein [Actinomyces trachealis]